MTSYAIIYLLFESVQADYPHFLFYLCQHPSCLVTDMSLYGLCPSRDEFYLVVCERCGQVIKPQALKKHVGKTGLEIHTFSPICYLRGLVIDTPRSVLQSFKVV